MFVSDDNEDDATKAEETEGGSRSQTASERAKKQVVEDEESKDESVSSNIKKICHNNGIFKADGFLDPYKLYQAFKDELLEIEDFKASLK